MTKKRIAFVAGGLTVALVGAMGFYRYQQARAPLRDILPAFTEPAAGPRAPTSEAFGMTVGRSGLPEVNAFLRGEGLDCADTSMRALMQKAREDKRKEIAAAAARGDPPDAVSGASIVNRRSPKEANPQVRLSCEANAAHANARGPGRLLMVFDSPVHPVRHVSFERSFPAAATETALAEFIGAKRGMEARFGPPTKGRAGTDGEPAEFVWLSPLEIEWTFADLRVRVTAVHYGARGVVVGETVEVPWPVRADAPARPAPMAALDGARSTSGRRLER